MFQVVAALYPWLDSKVVGRDNDTAKTTLVIDVSINCVGCDLASLRTPGKQVNDKVQPLPERLNRCS
jgi:hypothetical protein